MNIKAKEEEIQQQKGLLAEFIRVMHEAESQSMVEILLANTYLSDFFSNLERMQYLEKNININLEALKSLKAQLNQQKEEQKREKEKLKAFNLKLKDQKALNESVKSQKNILLKETKSQEAIYKKLLADRQAKAKALQEEIRAIEEQIRIIIDPQSLPRTGAGVLAWPLDKIKITQYFGNTPFATANPQVYPKGGHNGIDLRASIGTPVKAAEDGIVKDIGDTDLGCPGASYGKWILIEHPNNLSTMYAHLSLIKVKPGQGVARGQIIGYTGNTGYCTGPHLHFGVFATQAVKITNYRSKICGTLMKLPMVAPDGYLNPLSYL